MNRTSDIVVVGSGLAGMSAALTAAQKGKKVTLITHGAGTMAVSSGCIDVLGYLDKKRVDNPFEAMENLPAGHPYTLIGGAENVKEALSWFKGICRKGGMDFSSAGEEENHRLVTVMGTLKPSFFCPDSFNTECLKSVHRAAVVTVEGMKDVHPGLIIDQLRRYREFADMEFMEATLPCPVEHAHRNITPLDIARYVEKPEGEDWLQKSLAPYARLYKVLLVPPICGMKHSQQIWNRICSSLKVRIVEMVSIPPGVGGLRLREVLKNALNEAGVYMVENAEVVRAEVEDGVCRAVYTATSSGENRWQAESFVVATGGLLSGGIGTEPGKAWECIFGLPIEAPSSSEDWSSPDIFGKSFFASMGVKVNGELQPVDAEGNVALANVRFAGRILSGYDFAAEKSGQGVALSTGRYAGMLA